MKSQLQTSYTFDFTDHFVLKVFIQTFPENSEEKEAYSVHPLFVHDLNGENYDQPMTIFDLELRLKYD